MRRIFVGLVVIALSIMPSIEAGASKLPKLHGFFEEAFGARFGSDDVRHRQYNMAEARFQLKTRYFFEGDNIFADWQTEISAKCDFVLDLYSGGKFITELRDLNISFTPFDIVDVKAGRQVLTWGTGDYVFLNDLFPKDYISFLIGRDDEYLKKPNDALRIMVYPDWFNIDFVWIPFFQPNTVPTGYRISFFDSFEGGIAGVNSDRDFKEPKRNAHNFVYAVRVYRNFGSYETALYFYRGFDPSPRSYKDETKHQLFYQRLDAYGASIRGPLLGGIANAEIAYYYSPQDNQGDIRTIQNSMMKYLAGYAKDLGNDLSVGVQYYLEQTLDYSKYRDSLYRADYRWDEYRHTITSRVTKLFANQTLNFTIFTFFSPSDMDVYTRPSLTWKATDAWSLTIGGNLPWGKDSQTEFGSVQKNKNVYARLRYSF